MAPATHTATHTAAPVTPPGPATQATGPAHPAQALPTPEPVRAQQALAELQAAFAALDQLMN